MDEIRYQEEKKLYKNFVEQKTKEDEAKDVEDGSAESNEEAVVN